MNFSDAIKSVIRPHKEDKLTPLTTVWGEQIDPAAVLPKYPRPQMRFLPRTTAEFWCPFLRKVPFPV